MGFPCLFDCFRGCRRPQPDHDAAEQQESAARPSSETGAPAAMTVERGPEMEPNEPAPARPTIDATAAAIERVEEPASNELAPPRPSSETGTPAAVAVERGPERASNKLMPATPVIDGLPSLMEVQHLSRAQLLADYRLVRAEVAFLKAQGERRDASIAALEGQLTELGDALHLLQAQVQQVAGPTAAGEAREQEQEEGGCSNGADEQEEEEGEEEEQKLKELEASAASDGSGATTASSAPDSEDDEVCRPTRAITPAGACGPSPDGNVQLIARPPLSPPPSNGPAPFVPDGGDDEGVSLLSQAHPPCSAASSQPANGGDDESAPPQPQKERLIAQASPPPMALPGPIAAPTAQKRTLRRPGPMMPPGLQQQEEEEEKKEEEEEEEQAPPSKVKLYVLRSNAGQLSQQPSSTPPDQGPWAVFEGGGGFELLPSALVAKGPARGTVRMRSGAELERRGRAMLQCLVDGPFPSTVDEARGAWVYLLHDNEDFRGKDIPLKINPDWRLGSASIGAFGKIFFVGEAQGFTEDMVIKAIPLCSSDIDRQGMMDIYVWSSLREVWFHDMLAKHYPWVLSLKGADVVDGHVLIYMTPAEKGSLDRLCGRLDEPALKYVWQWLLTAQKVLRQLGLMHADIKPANVLMDAEGRLYLTDFGVMQTLNDDGRANMYCGTYRAPEVDAVRYHSGSSYGPPADLWSIGMTLKSMMDPSCDFSDECRALLERLVSHYPEERPGFSDPDTRRFLGLGDPDAEPSLSMPSPPPSFVACVGLLTGLGEVSAQLQVAFAPPVLSSEDDGEMSELDFMPSGAPGECKQLQRLQRLQEQAEMNCLPPGLLDED